MPQTNYTAIKLYSSTTPATAPLAAKLVSGELAINIADGKLFYKDTGNVVKSITQNLHTPVSWFTSTGATALTLDDSGLLLFPYSYTVGPVPYINSPSDGVIDITAGGNSIRLDSASGFIIFNDFSAQYCANANIINNTGSSNKINLITTTGTATLQSYGGSVGLNTTPTGLGRVEIAAGDTLRVPLLLKAGFYKTTAVAGGVEFDGNVFYASPADSTRTTIVGEQNVVLNTAYTLTSQTAAQKLFNASTTGAVTLPSGTYQFECWYSLSSMSATSGSFGFALGGGATFTQQWEALATKVAPTTATAPVRSYNTAANTALITANTVTTGAARIRGIINVTAGGTIIPQVSLGVAAAAVVGVGSYFKIYATGPAFSTTNVVVGNWS